LPKWSLVWLGINSMVDAGNNAVKSTSLPKWRNGRRARLKIVYRKV
jgi:hypothetical protein